ncbi:MAG: cytochrome b/b6 domain-containing protein [Acidobacteriia bacterium]|nr:cytochrome b/b6 domain-containing protein [Terriglobia bacterium]
MSPSSRTASPLIADDEIFVRMTLAQRLQHAMIIVAFTTLVVTGFPLVYPGLRVWDWIGLGPASFGVRSLVHRIAGSGLILVSLSHVAYVMLTEEGGRYFREMMPKLIDARQLVESVMHQLGLMDWLYRRGRMRGILDRNPWLRFAEPPEYGKYNWIEKFEYLAIVWGNFVMILTGLCLWFFEAAFALFPKPAIDIIKLVHGFEALLALLAIVIWHMYCVHLNPEVFPMSRMWLSGRISGKLLRHHYPGWYREIEAERRRNDRVEAALLWYDRHHPPGDAEGTRDVADDGTRGGGAGR